MAATSEMIRQSVEETDGFIDISGGKTEEQRNEERHGGEDKAPVPSYTPAINQMRGAESDDQISEIWKYITENLRQCGQISGDLLHRLYKCCFEEPNVCELLMMLGLRCCRCAKGSCKLILITAWSAIAKIAGCFTKKSFCQKNKTTRGTEWNETKIQMEDDYDGRQGSI